MRFAKAYELNYNWSKIGPHRWSEESIVTLQIDLESYDRARQLESAVRAWWSGFSSDEPGGIVTYEGGCRMIRPVSNERRPTMWLVSSGEDAFDSIAHYAGQLYDVAVAVDPAVRIVWTELPHHAPGERDWFVR